ncbi:chemotaxis protein [Erythrobacter sp. KY5]|uniref:methyl-accepting chemotaxis protein n=1 Tax=Erythrobacter sp. KY5 TaxID=2011159 RepID=UPI000DBEFB57|nr:HAMP domain-containing methyl-accepting chemotaxis protein [Erythrobacter sp. KY5]AWW75636.1 chemotaxis protein [Erythrobacter sp. KY5]
MQSAGFVPAADLDNVVARESDQIGLAWHERLSLAVKLKAVVFASTLVTFVLAGAILGTMTYFSQAGENLRALSTADASSANASGELYRARDQMIAFAQGGNQTDLAASRRSLDDASTFLIGAQGVDANRLESDLAEAFTSAQRDVERVAQRASGTAPNGEEARAIAARIGEINATLRTATEGLNERSIAAAEPVFNAIARSLVILLAAFIALTFASYVVSRKIANHVSDKITEMTHAMQEISQGSSDTVIPGRERGDEIGAMARALEVFRNSAQTLREMTDARTREVEEQLVQQQDISEQMLKLRHEKSQLLEGLADGFEVSVGELITAVSAASEQLKATSKQMVSLADGSNNQADSASQAMEKATANVTAAAAATDEFALSISEISRQASASATLARDATTLVASANTRMNDLAKAGEEIGEIAGLIQTIAQRTNLLALNASIEAARGGEAGRGFAVVASEVKELAMQTSNATSSVAEKIQTMQDSTRSSAGDLSSIVDQISELEKAAVMIASAVDQQSVSGEELARNIDTVAEGSRQVSQRLTELRNASEETGTAADDVVASANALGDHAEDLRTKAGRFIADVRRSARDLETGNAV